MTKNEGYSAKRQIMNAVMKLMSEKNYMDISVTDIVKTAGVARASFYRNFNSINDVVESVTDELSDELISDIVSVFYSTDKRKWREFLFNHFYRFTRIRREFGNIRPENIDFFFTCMNSKMEQKDSHPQTGALSDKYLAVAKLGLINSITNKWINSGMQETPEEIIDYITSFITVF